MQQIETLRTYLNTSHVKVNHAYILFTIFFINNLNTSHVKVNR